MWHFYGSFKLSDHKRLPFICIMDNFTPLMPQMHITHANTAVIILFIWSLLSDSNWLLCLPNKLSSSAVMLTHSWPEKCAPLGYSHCVICSVFHSSHFFSSSVVWYSDTVTKNWMHQSIGHKFTLPIHSSQQFIVTCVFRINIFLIAARTNSHIHSNSAEYVFFQCCKHGINSWGWSVGHLPLHTYTLRCFFKNIIIKYAWIVTLPFLEVKLW